MPQFRPNTLYTINVFTRTGSFHTSAARLVEDQDGTIHVKCADYDIDMYKFNPNEPGLSYDAYIFLPKGEAHARKD